MLLCDFNYLQYFWCFSVIFCSLKEPDYTEKIKQEIIEKCTFCEG